MHLALLAVLVLGFARAPRFDDAPESIPVETITSTQLNEIMQGEKTGKPAPSAARRRRRRRPRRPPKPPPRRAADAAARPQAAPPEPPKPPPPRPRPRPSTRRAEPVRPRPPKPEETPRPPEPAARRQARGAEARQVQARRDRQGAGEGKAAEEKPQPKPPAFDPKAINKLIDRRRTPKASPTRRPQGLANHNARHMSVALENALNEWFKDLIQNCWNLPPTNPEGENYVVRRARDLQSRRVAGDRPVLLNPPHDPHGARMPKA